MVSLLSKGCQLGTWALTPGFALILGLDKAIQGLGGEFFDMIPEMKPTLLSCSVMKPDKNSK